MRTAKAYKWMRSCWCFLTKNRASLVSFSGSGSRAQVAGVISLESAESSSSSLSSPEVLSVLLEPEVSESGETSIPESREESSAASTLRRARSLPFGERSMLLGGLKNSSLSLPLGVRGGAMRMSPMRSSCIVGRHISAEYNHEAKSAKSRGCSRRRTTWSFGGPCHESPKVS